MISKNPDSATRLAAVIGDPIAQSLSPVIHNAVFESLKVNWLYLAFLVETGKVKDALDAMSVFGIAGFSVTMPHKNEVAKLVREIGEIDEIVRVTNSANTVMLRQDGSIFATNTDGQGACNAIEANSTQKIAESRVVVLGAGGTASAVVHSLIKNGAAEGSARYLLRRTRRPESGASSSGSRKSSSSELIGPQRVTSGGPVPPSEPLGRARMALFSP